MTERQWQSAVIELATLYRWLHYHTHDSRRSIAGWPDLVLCRPPEIVFVELKTNKGKLRPEQIAWLELLKACGQECYVWRPSDLEEVHARLRR